MSRAPPQVSVTGKGDDVILSVARTAAARLPGKGARMLPLKLPCHLSGSVLLGGKRGRGQRNRSRNSQRQERSHGGAPHIERVAVIERTRWSR